MKQPMSSAAYRRALKTFGLTQARACWLFGGKSLRSGRLWASQGAPYYVALILTMMWKYQISPDQVEELGASYRPRIKKKKPNRSSKHVPN